MAAVTGHCQDVELEDAGDENRGQDDGRLVRAGEQGRAGVGGTTSARGIESVISQMLAASNGAVMPSVISPGVQKPCSSLLKQPTLDSVMPVMTPSRSRP